MKRYFIGVDNGGTMTKAAVFDAAGRQLASAGENTPRPARQPGWCDRDMEELWMAAARCHPKGVGCRRHFSGGNCRGRLYRPRQGAVFMGT